MYARVGIRLFLLCFCLWLHRIANCTGNVACKHAPGFGKRMQPYLQQLLGNEREGMDGGGVAFLYVS